MQLLSEEYSSLSPGQLEVQGLINPSEQQKYMALSSSPEAQRKFSGNPSIHVKQCFILSCFLLIKL